MSIKDSTKILFAEALQDMIKTLPLSKIRIKDLCDKCGTERQTFYYHFKDKFDLVGWIFEQDFKDALEMTNGTHGVESLTYSLIKLKEKQAFYKKAFADNSQNGITSYIQDYDINIFEQILKKHLGIIKLNEEIIFAIKYHSYGCLYFCIEWLTGNSNLTAEEFAKLQYKYMPPIIKEALLKK
ncbi:TetR/AcrR family transcriptional regulator C-terminal domain-containing protein [Clostridium saccharobutylicum]|uniref:HTH-type dhaKLM operon transcriptional activator DhaS n=1 Tax=Clostridium saccharobutylicum TaxID=169679 RepID=A0A1S8MQC4_CLOSA|nr:TetR/AcrR family transcriptional regulator C-terminal domain-containing protein [Clostridium saccharobutylicum]OOM06393.1 HTH-type dhaKLM operon transcriptional activator DhaS [Clostridium saccharobutylicum]